MGIVNEFLGKHCKDKVTGFEGICTYITEWMYGCAAIAITSDCVDTEHTSKSSIFFSPRLEILDDGVAGQFEIKSDEPKYFGKICQDKIHKSIVGICVGRISLLGASEQYGIEIQPEDLSKESRIVWLDEGRIELFENQEDAINPEDISGDNPGGVLDPDFYPTSSLLL